MHRRLSVHSICFPDCQVAELPGMWRAVGATRVSLNSLQLPGSGVGGPAPAAGSCALETVTHLFSPTQPLSPNEQAWREPQEKLDQAIDAAVQAGARSIYMLTGGRGDMEWEQAAECFSAAIAPCVAHARAAGIELMIETTPSLYAQSHIAHSLRDTVTLAEMADIGVCIDIFSCWTEAGLQQTIERAMPRCHLVQVSDYVHGDRALPARAVPGDGAIPLERIFGWILAAGYRGTFNLELLGPRIDQEGRVEAVRRAADSVGTMLDNIAGKRVEQASKDL